MFERSFQSAFVRRRMAASHLGIILPEFILDLQARGHVLTCIQSYGQIGEHFSRWLAAQRISVCEIDETVLERFVQKHLPHCRCPKPAPTHVRNCRAALRRLLAFLRRRRLVPERPSIRPSEIDRLVLEYDGHLAEVGAFAPLTRQYLRRYAREFLQTRLIHGRLELRSLRPRDLVSYVQGQATRLKPSSLRVLAGALRSLLRFLYLIGRGDERLVSAVPRPAPWPRSTLPQVLSDEQSQAFLHSFDQSTGTGLRDYAMAMCLSRLGMRTHEVAALTLHDFDRDRSTLRLRQTKQRRERLLPLLPDVARAIVNYLRRGRPPTDSDALFVRHRAPLGQALRVHHVRGAMRRALQRGGLASTGVHLLRHTLATRLHRRGIGLKAIADLLGHGSLDTTARYARVNLEELRQAALPWPSNWR
jgi:site-specific recombinase XerD